MGNCLWTHIHDTWVRKNEVHLLFQFISGVFSGQGSVQTTCFSCQPWKTLKS